MRKLAIFVGPSLAGWDAPDGLEPFLWPPIRNGDLARLPAIESGGWTVAIIDGEFGSALAVNVAEIRDVLAAGNAVIGGASMGALRSVECEPLGMRPVGWIAQQYRSGAVWADDEVALIYLDGDFGYQPLTVPLINLRWLLRQQLKLAPPRADVLLAACARLHFRDRTPDRLLDATGSVDAEGAALLAEHLPAPRRSGWDRKRLDAIEVVEAVRDIATKGTAR